MTKVDKSVCGWNVEKSEGLMSGVPTFSIIIPVYNVASYLRDCLNSVLAQTCTDWEAICVDDGSTDGSEVILDEYAKKDKRIRVLHRENAGVSAARNAGLDCAQGEYVTFLDGDDFYRPDWLSAAEAVIRQKAVDIVRLRYVVWDGTGALPTVRGFADEPMYFIGSDAVRSWGWKTFMVRGMSWLLFVRRVAASGVGNMRFPVGMRNREDNIYTLRVARVAVSACQAGYNGYVYRRRCGSAVLSTWPLTDVIRYFDECLAVAQEWMRGENSCPLTDPQKLVLSSMLWEFVREWLWMLVPYDRDAVRSVRLKCLEAADMGLLKIRGCSWQVCNFLFLTLGMTLPMRLKLLLRAIYIWMRSGRWE